MQESGVQWDLRECPSGPAVPTRFYILFLLVCCIWVIVVLIKAFWTTRSWPSTRRGELLDLSQALQAGDASKASDVAARIPDAAPEAALRCLAVLRPVAFHQLPPETLARADLHFTFVLYALHATANNLRSLSRLLLILTAAWTAYGLANICKGISYMKATGISAVYGGLTEVLGILCVSLFILAILYALRWRIVSLLGRRERLWSQLKGHLELLLAARPPHP